MKILYTTKKNTIGLMSVNPELLESMTLLEAAKKLVPAGKPFKLVNEADLPDLEFQRAWVVDFTTNDGIGERA